ncbi:MAG: co-chaperone GroES [Mycobacterium sp.]
MKPLEDNVLVHVHENETVTPSGLVIPDTAASQPQSGTVVAVGPGRWDEESDQRIPLEIAEGDTVVYNKYAGIGIRYEGEDVVILGAGDLLAVVHGEKVGSGRREIDSLRSR